MPHHSEKQKKKHSEKKMHSDHEEKIVVCHERKIITGNFNPIFTSIACSLNNPLNSNGFFTKVGNIVTATLSTTFSALVSEDDQIGANFTFILPLPMRFNFNNVNQVTGTVSILSNNPSTVVVSQGAIKAEINTNNQARIFFAFSSALPSKTIFLIGASFQYSLNFSEHK